MAKHLDAHGKPYNRTMMIIVLLIGTFCTVLNQTLLTTALPKLMNTFSVSTATVQWLTTAFLMINGIMIPVSAYLSVTISSKWLYISSMLVFFIGTVVAYVAPNFWVLLAARIIQGAGVGITMPLLQTIMLSIFPQNQRGTALGIAGIVIGVAPAVGPTLSGWIIDQYQWRDLFGMLIPIMVIVLIGSFFYMKPVLNTHKQKLDWLSLILSTIGFGSLLYGFSEAGNNGWDSTQVYVTLIVGAIVVAFFVWRQFVIPKPFLQLRVFKVGEFTLAAILSSVVMIAMLGVEVVLPLYLQIVHGMSAFHSGLTLLVGALALAVMSPITGKTFDRLGGRDLAIIGLFLLTVGTIPFLWLTRSTPTIFIIVLYAIRMFGISMVFMPVTTSGMNALPDKLIADGTASNNTVRQVFASMGSAIMVTILSNITDSQQPAHHLLTQSPLAYKIKTLDANLNGYRGAFLFAAIFAAIALILAFFLKKNPNPNNQGSSKTPGEAHSQAQKTNKGGQSA